MPFQRPLKEKLLQDNLRPEPGRELALGNELGNDRRRYNPGSALAIASRAIAAPFINAANQTDFPVNFVGIFSAGEEFVGLAANWTALLVLRQVAVNLLGWKFLVELSAKTFGSRLFAPIAFFIRGFRILRILLISAARIASRVFYLVGFSAEYLSLQPNNPDLQGLELLVFFNKLNCLRGYVLLRIQSSLLPNIFPLIARECWNFQKLAFWRRSIIVL